MGTTIESQLLLIGFDGIRKKGSDRISVVHTTLSGCSPSTIN